MRLLLVYNATAGPGRSARHFSALSRLLAKLHPGSELVRGASSRSARQVVAQTDLSDFDAVVAAGGDGTLFQVLNGLYANRKRRPLGVVPMGTGNAFAREFGLSANNWRQAVERFSPKRLQRIDVGQVCWAGGEFYFLNVIGLGYAADAGLAAHKVKFVGRSAYTLGALWRLLRLRTYPLEMALDGDPIQQDNVFVEISNSRYTGTSFLMAPDAQLDDGLLDVTWLRRVHRARLSCLFRSIFRGRHIMHPEVETRQVREVELRAPQGSQLMCDGEFHGRTPATVRCRHRDLEWLG